MRERRQDDVAMPDFTSALAKMTTTSSGKELVQSFMQLLCEVIDSAIEHGDSYVSIGLNRPRTKVMLTLTEGNVKSYAVGATLEEWLTDIKGLA